MRKTARSNESAVGRQGLVPRAQQGLHPAHARAQQGLHPAHGRYHGPNKASILLTLAQRDEALCLCRDPHANAGTIDGLRFNPDVCAPLPKSQLLSTHNSICNISAYGGGLYCCHGGSILLDAEQTQPRLGDTWHLKYRFYFEEYMSQVNAFRVWWSTEATNNECVTPTPALRRSRAASHQQPTPYHSPPATANDRHGNLPLWGIYRTTLTSPRTPHPAPAPPAPPAPPAMAGAGPLTLLLLRGFIVGRAPEKPSMPPTAPTASPGAGPLTPPAATAEVEPRSLLKQHVLVSGPADDVLPLGSPSEQRLVGCGPAANEGCCGPSEALPAYCSALASISKCPSPSRRTFSSRAV